MQDTSQFLLTTAIGLCIAQSLLMAWFETELVTHLPFNIGRGAFTRRDVFDGWVMRPLLGSHFLTGLLTCRICLSFWISLAVSGVLAATGLYGDNHACSFLLALGWPALLHRLK